MMSFCKKSVHSFLGLTIPMNNNLDNSNNNLEKQPYSSKSLPVLTSSGLLGLGLITATDIDNYKTPPHVLESTTFNKTSSSSSPPPLLFKKDPGGIGFIDDVGGGVNGLMSCTESLGFESCDERRVDDEIDELCSRTRSSSSTTTNKVVNWRKVGERREVKKFPPPLSSLNHNGQPSFFLRPVRKDGRLELTEVRIDRPEILRASRGDGRLTLHFIRDDDEEDNNDSNLEEYQDQEYEPQQELVEEQEDEKEVVQKNIEEQISEEWNLPVTGEGFRRCHELVTHHHHDYHHHHHHHHHNLHVWSQHCVTTT